MDEFTVELRIHGRKLDVPSVSAALGLEPSLIRRVGERRDASSTWDEALWAYNGLSESNAVSTWASLDDGLSFILEKLWPVKDIIKSYEPDNKVILWCGHFYSDLNSSISLSPELLARLGDLGVELFIDSYYSPESAQQQG